MSKELLQQALDALVYHTDQTRPIASTTAAIAALEATLTQSVQPCMGCNGHGEVGGLRSGGYESEICPFCKGSGIEQIAQPASVAQAEPIQEPIYQYQSANGKWIDQAKDSYDYNVKMGQAVVRVLYASLQVAQPTPVAQAEPLSDEQIKKIARFIHLTEESRDFERLFARAVIEAIKPPIGVQA